MVDVFDISSENPLAPERDFPLRRTLKNSYAKQKKGKGFIQQPHGYEVDWRCGWCCWNHRSAFRCWL